MDAAADPQILSAAEARVLGCLIEKQATTPDVYPLTINAAQTAANQKTSREPVMALHPGQVQQALRSLEGKGLARQVYSSRAERYEHATGTALRLVPQQLGLLCLLLLRGAQTPGELLARSDRLVDLAGLEDVRHHLQRLIEREPPLVVRIPAGGGRREDRYAHLLCGGAPAAPAIPEDGSNALPLEAPTGLEARVAALEAELADVKRRLELLQASLPD